MTQLGKGRAAAITPAEMVALADELGCHPAELEAIAKVESGGFGWYRDGRMKILFEKHWFYKLVEEVIRGNAVEAGLARGRWVSPKKGGYRDQRTPDQRYDLLRRAIDIDEDAALQSISMGRFQIMGFNWKICGFASPVAMWEAFLDSEHHQLQALANFLRSKGLMPAIRRGDFRKIEKVYNGGGLRGVYAARMKAESNKLRAGKWKGYRPGSIAIVPGARPERENQRSQPTNESGAVPRLRTVAKPTKIAPAPDVVAEERAEPHTFLVFLVNLVNRLLFYRRTSWTPFKDAEEQDFENDCR